MYTIKGFKIKNGEIDEATAKQMDALGLKNLMNLRKPTEEELKAEKTEEKKPEKKKTKSKKNEK